MKINWKINSSGNALCAIIEDKHILLNVYRCSVDGLYIQQVWLAGRTDTYSKSSHNCCISAMVHAEAAATELSDELALKSAVWQEV